MFFKLDKLNGAEVSGWAASSQLYWSQLMFQKTQPLCHLIDGPAGAVTLK